MVNWSELVNDAPEAFTAPGPLPEGDYTFVVDDVKAGQSKNGGKKQYILRNKVDDGGSQNGRTMQDWLTVSPESKVAIEIFFGKMAGLGLTKEFFQSEPTDEQVVNAIKGRRFRSRVKHKLRDGETRADFGRYFPVNQTASPVPGGGVAAPAGAGAPPIPSAAPLSPPPAAAAPAPAAAPQQNPWETQQATPAAAGDPWSAPAAPAAPAPAPQPVGAAAGSQGTPDVPPPPAAPF